MARREANLLAQAADLFAPGELDALLDVATPGEVAEEGVRRLLRAGRRPWWPAATPGDAADPWEALAATDVVVLRAPIPELGRYYDAQRAIVLREGLSAEEERAVLWHELVHAERRHRACELTAQEHAEVEREAQRRAVRCA